MYGKKYTIKSIFFRIYSRNAIKIGKKGLKLGKIGEENGVSGMSGLSGLSGFSGLSGITGKAGNTAITQKKLPDNPKKNPDYPAITMIYLTLYPKSFRILIASLSPSDDFLRSLSRISLPPFLLLTALLNQDLAFFSSAVTPLPFK